MMLQKSHLSAFQNGVDATVPCSPNLYTYQQTSLGFTKLMASGSLVNKGTVPVRPVGGGL